MSKGTSTDRMSQGTNIPVDTGALEEQDAVGSAHGERSTGNSPSRKTCPFAGLCDMKYAKVSLGILAFFAVGLVFFFQFAADLGDGLERTMEEGGTGESTEYDAPLSYGDDYPHALLAGIVGFCVVFALVVGYGKTRERTDEA